ncbi:MAG TPA: DUF6064 family protein [Vicinamibacterales bacterium]|nr:DUF6064 family protein [Vicinamibacterales bacterium]
MCAEFSAFRGRVSPPFNNLWLNTLCGVGIRPALFAADVKFQTAMQLPFTKEQFFDLFVAYNAALWPAVVALWIASAVIVALRLPERRPHDRWISALLVAHWAWSALAYFVAFFTRINPAAWLFAALFLGQAVLLFRAGIVQRRLSFAPWDNRWAPLAWVLIGYSLAYPAINAIDHLSLVRIPTFGLPCPTTIFTAGVLMLATPRSWRLATVPVIWSAIGGSAAFLLGVNADLALPIAGMALAIFSVRTTTLSSQPVESFQDIGVKELAAAGTKRRRTSSRKRTSLIYCLIELTSRVRSDGLLAELDRAIEPSICVVPGIGTIHGFCAVLTPPRQLPLLR